MINEKLIKSGGIADPEFTGVTTNLIVHLDAGHSASYGGSGNTWSDLSGNNNHFTLDDYNGSGHPEHTASADTNNPYKIFKFTEAKLNYAYKTTDIANLDNYTIETWVYDMSGDNNYSYYWSNDVQPFGSPYYYQLLRSADGYNDKMHFYANYDGTNVMGAGSPGANVTVPYNGWCHWMLIKNGADVHVVKNGLIEQTLTAGETDSANLNYANTQGNPQYTSGRRVYIGTADHTQGNTGYYSNMEVSEVRFYSRALTEKEIRENFNATCSRYGVTSAATALSEDIHFALCAGGGGGGYGHASGGGGGGFRTSYTANTDLSKSGGNNPAEAKYSLKTGVTYTITVGAGGSGLTSPQYGNPGGKSSIAASGQKTLIASGGAGGSGGVNFSNVGGTRGGCGSGGGGWSTNRAGYKGTTGQGYGGGTNTAATFDYAASGGSGGAGGAGGSVTSNPYNGGGGGRSLGFIMPIGGFNYFSNGGGGGSSNAAGTSGGGGGWPYGAGSGGSNMTNATSASRVMPGNGGRAGGGGGGGAGQTGVGFSTGGNGAAGMVYLRVPSSSYTGTTSGSPTVYTSGSDKILLFTGSGSYTH